MGITPKDIRKMRNEIMKHQIPPNYIKTQEEANRMNENDKTLGIESNWKVGDSYFCMFTADGMMFGK